MVIVSANWPAGPHHGMFPALTSLLLGDPCVVINVLYFEVANLLGHTVQ